MKKLICLGLILAVLCTSALAEVGLTGFATTDMEGHEVTQEIFADYDLTVVNVWVTWCGYCVSEMPDLSQLKAMLPDNVNFITLCQDSDVNRALAEDILRDAGANFQTLVITEELNEQIEDLVYAFPTTLFLNSEGACVVQPLSGALPVEGYRDVTMSVLALLEG